MEPSKLLDWTGKTCVIAASGPSLSEEQCRTAEFHNVPIIAVNSTYERFLSPIIYGCDYLFWRHYHAHIPKRLWGQCWTQDRSSAERFNLNFVRQASRPGLGHKALHVNGCSGFGAVNLAYLFGCRRILLIGMDMKLGPKGERHWHKDHPAPLVQNQPFGEWLHKSQVLARDLEESGTEVINCTPGSALTCFKTAELGEALKC